MTRDLSRLLRPNTIAVVGGGSWCAHVVENCRKLGFDGAIWPVHPDRKDIAGVPAYASVADLPLSPDATFIGVNRVAAIKVMAGLAQRGAGGAVVYASGFREALAETADGGDLQDQLLKAAGETVLIGPNCYGFLNYLDGAALWPDQQGGARVERGVALITQSSNIAINLTMQRRGLPLAYVVTAGNQAQTGLAEIGKAVLDDPRVTALGLHIEGVGDLRAFEALTAHARALGKPIVALKAGRTEQSRAAAVSHTASIAGSDAGARALFQRNGVAQVNSLGALLETLKLLHVTGPLTSNRIGSMSCSGGEASLMADSAASRAVVFPALDAAQTSGLRAALGPKVALANPLDYHTYIWNDAQAMTATFSAMMDAPLALGVVVLDFPRTDRCTDDDWDTVIDAVAKTMADTGKPMAIIASLPENMPQERAEHLIALGIAPLTGLEDGLDAVAAAAWLGQKHPLPTPQLLPRPPIAAHVLSEAEGKAILADFGGVIPRAVLAGPDELKRASQNIGYPLVLKAEGVAHKTEAGAVALGLASEAAVLNAAHKMQAESYLVEEMIADGVAELLLGVVLDPAHGYLMTMAAGGIFTEILQDSTSLLLPATADAIADALMTLRIAPLLNGYRGRPSANLQSIVNAALAVQAYVLAHHGQVEEVEINPLICTQTRAVVADVLIKTGEPDD